jgi:hypothetical protein
MQLSIRCRGARSELVITGPALSGRGEGYVISYRVNGGQPVQVGGATAFGSGVALKSDTVRLLQSLPGEGELVVHLTSRSGVVQDGIFSLVGLDAVRNEIAAACKWPLIVAKPSN